MLPLEEKNCLQEQHKHILPVEENKNGLDQFQDCCKDWFKNLKD
jgi:hypothetical protein